MTSMRTCLSVGAGCSRVTVGRRCRRDLGGAAGGGSGRCTLLVVRRLQRAEVVTGRVMSKHVRRIGSCCGRVPLLQTIAAHSAHAAQ